VAQDWDIKPRAETCGACAEGFGDGDTYYSVLVYGEEGYARADYCKRCWESGRTGKPAYGSWQGVFRLPPPPKEEPLRKETAEALLRRMMEEEDADPPVMYILAVMLERKRILVERDVQTGDRGERVRVYEHRETGETFIVVDPRLSLDALEPVQQRVAEMLAPETSERVEEGA